MDNLFFNILRFEHPDTEKDFAFFLEQDENAVRFHINKLPEKAGELFPEIDKEKPFLYTNFKETEENAVILNINLDEHKAVARAYYRELIRTYLKQHIYAATPNFIKDSEFWFPYPEKNTEDYNVMRKFTVRVQIEYHSGKPEIQISYDGISKIYKNNVEELIDSDIDTKYFSYVIYNKELVKFEELPDEANYEFENIYPVLNFDLYSALKIPFETPDQSNKYKRYYEQIIWFFDNYINSDEFKRIIPHTGKWKEVNEDKIHYTNSGSNELQFGQNHTDIVPYYGLKQGGPYKPSPYKHIKMFFILHENDKDKANDLTKFMQGKKGFVPFRKFFKIPLVFAKDRHILFKDQNNPLPEIISAIQEMPIEEDTRYIAIYISSVSKHEHNPEKRSYYYKIKEELLKRHITSQVIEDNSIENDDFKFFVTNIGIAILAKLDGVPWRLDREPEKELIIGIGAFKSNKYKQKYIGSAFCFSNDGTFKGFNAFPSDDMFLLAGSIREAVEDFIEQNKTVERVVIHFYKTMSAKELKPIKRELFKLGLEIPVIVISMNKTESKDIVVFDKNYFGKMPYSGRIIKIGFNKYLLCNNTRYSNNQEVKIESYPLPVKIHIQSDKKEILEDVTEVKKLIDQVYQFSRMYWKSVKQQNLPVTLKYPEMVAQIFPHFDSNIMPEFGQKNLWFL